MSVGGPNHLHVVASLSSLASLLLLPSPIIVIVVVLFGLISVGYLFGFTTCGLYHISYGSLPGQHKYSKHGIECHVVVYVATVIVRMALLMNG